MLKNSMHCRCNVWKLRGSCMIQNSPLKGTWSKCEGQTWKTILPKISGYQLIHHVIIVSGGLISINFVAKTNYVIKIVELATEFTIKHIKFTIKMTSSWLTDFNFSASQLRSSASRSSLHPSNQGWSSSSKPEIHSGFSDIFPKTCGWWIWAK